jgi:Protein of unknown function (DUF1579)
MKIEIGLASLAFVAGMTVQAQLQPNAATEESAVVQEHGEHAKGGEHGEHAHAGQDHDGHGKVHWKDWGDDPMANPEFMAAWMAAATPGESHAEIAKAAGEWNVDQVMYMGPDQDGIPGKATTSSRMVLGGRVLIEEYNSEFQGMPMEGLLLLGYDNIQQEYWSIWLDNFSTWPSMVTGKRDADGKVNAKGLMHDISTPGGRPYRHVSWMEGDDTARAEMFDSLPDGSEFKVMEFTYKRK